MNIFFKRCIIMSCLCYIGVSFAQHVEAVTLQDSDVDVLAFKSFIKKAEANEAIKNYFNAIETANVKLISRDKISLNEFLKTTDTVFGKSLIGDEVLLTNYTLVDFNVMYSAYVIQVKIKEVSGNSILKNTSIEINY